MPIQNFRPIPTITVANDYWENKKWRFNIPAITTGTGATPEPIVVTVSGIGAVTLVNAIDDGLVSCILKGGTEQLPETYLDTVTLSGGCEQRNLPVGYTQVEYLKATGAQLINTGISGNDDDLVIDIVCKYSAWVQYGAILGNWVQDGYDATRIITAGTNNDKLVVNYNNLSGDSSTTVDAPKNTRLHIILKKGFITINGVTAELSSDKGTTNNNVIALFNRNVNNPANRNLQLEIESYFVTKNNVVIQNLIPCRRNSDSVLGMYDTVSGQFFTNAGTGTFTAGAEVTPTPDTPMDIVSNNGVVKVSPNLFNSSTVMLNKVCNADGSVVSSNPNFCTQMIPIIGGKTYAFYGRTKADNTISAFNRINWFDANGDNISPRPTYTVDTATIATAPSNAKYAILGCAPINTTAVLTQEVVDSFNWTFTEAIEEVPYMPYGQIYTDGTVEQVTDSLGNTASAERLLAVGDYKDTQEVLSGSVNRQLGIYVLDGTETCIRESVGGNIFYRITTDINHVQNVSGVMTIGYCTHFKAVINSAAALVDGTFVLGGITNQILIGKTGFSTVEQFKQWLADQYANGTPVIIVYPLATATTESVSGQSLSKSPVTQTAGSIDNLPIAITESSHTVPTPQQPLPINCNNGVLKARHQSGLPWGYTKIEYLKSVNTQAIDTGVKYTGNDFVIEWEAKDTSATVQGTLFACTSQQPFSGGLFGTSSSRKYYIGAGQGIELNYSSNDGNYHKWKIVVGGQTVTLYKDDVQIGTSTFTGNIDTAHNIYLFCGGWTSSDNQALVQFAQWQLKSWKFTDNGVLKFNAIPAKNGSNVAGIYDTVSGTFLTNVGTGDFTAGNPVSDAIEIYTDGTTETVEVTGKNLFTGQADITQGYYLNDNGATTSATGLAYTNGYTVVNGGTYTFSGYGYASEPLGNFSAVCYDENKNALGRVGRSEFRYNYSTFTTLPNTKYLRFNIPVNTTSTSPLQLELGSTATTYEPYTVLGTATAEMLLKIGTYQDIQSVLDGEVTRKIGIKALDGTEDIGKSGVYAGSFFVRNVVSNWGTSNKVQVYCSHFNGVTAESNYTLNKCMILNNAFNMWWASDSTPTVAQFKQYLADQYNAGSPVIIVYPLAESTTETVESQALTIQEGTNIVEITQASMNNLELEVSYKAGVAVTITEIENAQLDNSVEVTING